MEIWHRVFGKLDMYFDYIHDNDWTITWALTGSTITTNHNHLSDKIFRGNCSNKSLFFKSLPNHWHMVPDITIFEKKNIWKVLQVILWALIKVWWSIVSRIYFWRNLSPGLLRSSLSTNYGWSNAKRISSRRARKELNVFDVESMSRWSSRGRYVLCLALLQPVTDLS